jgi:hypothetical protein
MRGQWRAVVETFTAVFLRREGVYGASGSITS